MTVLVTGSRGQVGFELTRILARSVKVLASDRNHMNLADPVSIRSRFRECEPDMVINCAAFTAVDRAEVESDLAFRINAAAPGILAEESARRASPLVHLSTDYVFDGAQDSPYSEEDPPNPVNFYGRSKLAGEQAVISAGCPYVIVRTSWVYGSRGSNFARKILASLEEGGDIRVVDDQRGSPTWCQDLAEAVATIVASIRHEEAFRDPYQWSGLYHVAGEGSASRYEFAMEIARWVEATSPERPSLVPVSTKECPAIAARPRNSALACGKARERFGIVLPPWQVSTKRVVEEYRS
jgi:dTDP-4-dehydrorhamnose reductase